MPEENKPTDQVCICCRSDNVKLLEAPSDEKTVPVIYLYHCNDCGKEFEIYR